MSWPTYQHGKKTFYQNRGKVHFSKDNGKTYCGLDLGDVNHFTLNEKDVTCQKCLMIQTREWKPTVKKEKKKR